ncbi:hypothetical protein Vafri_20459 [Volvox africanus]|nr:hypothetical protein Vafri_20459 [Volvox africanus]
MRSKQMKFMRYLVGGPSTYPDNLRCKHLHLIQEHGLDLQKFEVVQGLLLDTFKEMEIPQDVMDDMLANVNHAKTTIFTPNADELVTAEEMMAAAEELQNPLITRLGGPQAVQLLIQAFYKKLFSSEQLKYFFVSLSAERLRKMQFKFMGYLLCGPASYAVTGGNMRCVHARMVKDDGLDLEKFNMVVDMLMDVLNDLMVAKKNVREIMSNVDAAREAIFTPGPDELVTKEEMVAEAASLDGDLVARLGGPEAVYDFISRFYAKLFNDQQLKYFFLLSADRLRTKQFRFMRYLLAGPAAYAALGGNLRCRHLPLIRDKGLDTDMFRRAVDMLRSVIAEMGDVPSDVVEEIFKNVEAAKEEIFTPGPEELVTREEVMRAAEALNSPLVEALGGPGRVYNVVSSFYARVFHDEQLKYFFSSLSAEKLRAKQFKLMAYLFGGPDAYAAASPGGNLRCVHARMVRDHGLDLEKFNRVAEMMLITLKEEDAPEEVVAGVLKNVDAAREAIFTPGPDELVTKEEMVAEAASLDGDLVARLGGPEAVYDFISRFYAKLFNDQQLKYFFVLLAAERLRAKQFKFMRYLVGGPGTYTAGDLRCVHAKLVSERGLDEAKFERAVSHLKTIVSEMDMPEDVVSEIMRNVQIAKEAILGPDGSGSGALSARSLYARLGGDVSVGKLVDEVHTRLQALPNLGRIYDGVDMAAQRSRQLAFLRSVWGGGGMSSRPGSSGAACALTTEIAHAHLGRGRSLSSSHLEAIGEVWLESLMAQGASPEVISEVRCSLGAGKSLIYPPGAAVGCPFSSALGMDDESALEAFIAAQLAATGVEVTSGASPNSAAAAATGGPVSSSQTLCCNAPPAGALQHSITSDMARASSRARSPDAAEKICDAIGVGSSNNGSSNNGSSNNGSSSRDDCGSGGTRAGNAIPGPLAAEDEALLKSLLQ